MKKMKRFVALALSVVMVLAMSVAAFAEDNAPESTTAAGNTTTGSNYTITINNETTGHIYEAYQIFKGDLSVKETGEKVLSNIAWGNGISATGQGALGDAASKAGELTEDNAATFAKTFAGYLQNPKESTQGDKKYTISDLEAGYYLIKDKNDTLKDQNNKNKDDFYTAYILEVVGNVTTNPKGNKPSLEKEIKHNENGTWGTVGDNQIGDTVDFRTITTVPDITGYTTYSYIIHDTMSAGLTSNVKSKDDVTIKVNDNTVLDRGYYDVQADGNTFSITVYIKKAIEDKKMSTGNSLYSYYSGVLNKDALIYDQGKQDNTAYLEYSNNPNNTENKGKTPDKKVYDWTFKMGVKKIDKTTKQNLTGAKFVLSKKEGLQNLTEDNVANNTDLISLVKVENEDKTYTYTVAPAGTEGTTKVIEAGETTIKGLDDATDYYLYEIKAPAHYNKLKNPVKFRITAPNEGYTDGGNAIAQEKVTVKIDNNQESSSTLVATIENSQGSNLPSTGGIGTTIFYVVGGILMVGAAVLLITKRRAEN